MGRSQKNWGMLPIEIQMVLCNRRNHAKIARLLSSIYSARLRQGGGGGKAAVTRSQCSLLSNTVASWRPKTKVGVSPKSRSSYRFGGGWKVRRKAETTQLARRPPSIILQWTASPSQRVSTSIMPRCYKEDIHCKRNFQGNVKSCRKFSTASNRMKNTLFSHLKRVEISDRVLCNRRFS